MLQKKLTSRTAWLSQYQCSHIYSLLMADSSKLSAPTTLVETLVDDHLVRIIAYPPSILNEPRLFTGQKLLHPFQLKQVSVQNTWSKDTSKVRTEPTYDENFLSEGIDKEIQTAYHFEIKVDGQGGIIVIDENGVPKAYTKYDVKRNESGEFKKPPPNSIPGEPKPTDPAATHWPHYVPLESDPKMYKFNLIASELAKKSGKLDSVKQTFTCEYMGKKFNSKKSDPIDSDGVIVPHGLLQIEIPTELRTYNGFLQIFQAIPYIEGIIVHGETNVWKIRRDMFCVNGEKLKWPTIYSFALSAVVALV